MSDLPLYPNPVIFLPGIMGSALRDQYPVNPESVWSPFKLLTKAYDRITLHPSDPRYELAEPARVAPDQVFDLVYGEFIEELRHNLSPQADEPAPVFPFAYDWRQPLESVENALADFVQEVIDRTRLLRHYHAAGFGSERFPGRVNLVGHSMGGLVMAGYVQKRGMRKVNRLASIGSPFRGSLEAVAKTATGVGALGTASGSSREREAARVTPALYYLLPSFAGAVIAEEGCSDDLFRPEAWQPGIRQSLASFLRRYGLAVSGADDPTLQAEALRLLQSMLDGAWRHRKRLERLRLEDPRQWLCIIGVNEKTRVRMRSRRGSEGQPWFDLSDHDVLNQWAADQPAQRTLTGDNTVPYLGARASFIPTDQVVCVSPQDFGLLEFKDRLLENVGFHATLPSMNLVQRLVVSHFKGRKYGDIWGRPAPDLPADEVWDPPIRGLGRK
jgi:pimeloyl-ACP methyl ester carboxylesterase